MFSVPVILLIVAAVVGAIGIVLAIVGAVRSRQQPSTDAPEQSRWGDELGFRPDAEGVHAAVSQWEHGPAADGGLSEPKDPATGEFAGHPALIFAQDDGWIVAVQRDTASSVVVEIHPQPNEDADESGKATDLQVYSSDVDAMIRATDDRLVEILDNHPTDLAMAWFEGYWSAALLPLDDDGVDVEIDPDDKINEELPYVLNWLANLNDALRVLPPKEGEEESLSLQGVGPTRPLADRTDADSLPVDADSFEPEEAGLLPANPSFPGDVPVSDGSLAGLVAGGVGAAGAGAFVGSGFGDEPAEDGVVSDTATLTVVGDQPVAPIWEEDESADESEPAGESESAAPADAADIDEPITEEELAAAVAADESVAIDAADDDLLTGNDLLDDGIDGDDDLLDLPDGDLPGSELPNNVIPFTPAGGAATGAAVTGGLAGLTVVSDLPGDEGDELDADTSAGLAEDDFVTFPADDENTPAPIWAPDEKPTGELAVNHVDESALLTGSWEPQEHIAFADLSADDERNADDTFVTEADFAEAGHLMGEDLDGSDVGTEDTDDIGDIEAEADALAAAPEDTRPRISFVKPASPAETGPLPIVNPAQPYYPERDEQKPAAHTTPAPAVTIPQPQKSVSTGSHAVRDGEPSTMQTGQFPIINPAGAREPGRHARGDNEDDNVVRPSWFVPGKTSRRSRLRDEDEEQPENGLSAADADTPAGGHHAQPEVSDDDN